MVNENLQICIRYVMVEVKFVREPARKEGKLETSIARWCVNVSRRRRSVRVTQTINIPFRIPNRDEIG